MEISYSFHLSSKRHAVTDTNIVSEVSRHNLRQYMSEHYDRNKIEIFRGSDKSILDDVKRIYHEEFDDALANYNSGKREDRKIKNYLNHVSRSRNDVACEIIIQLGDMDFWSDKSIEEWRRMSDIFRHQLTLLESLLPEFKVASAVAHYDELSPHMHVVGVPVAEGYKRGMKKQAAKTKIFTPERLRELQTKLHEDAEHEMQLPQYKNIFSGTDLKEKEKGRNKDIPKQSLAEYRALQKEIKKANEDLKETLIQKKIQEKIQEDSIRQARQEASDLYWKSVKRQAESKKLEKTISKKLQKSSELAKELSEADNKLAVLEEKIADKNVQISEIDKQLKDKKAKQKEYDQTIQKQKKEINSLFNQIERMRSDSFDAERLADEKRQEIAELDRQKKGLQKELNQIIARTTDLKDQEQSLSPKIARMRSELAESKSLAGEVEQKRQEVAELDRQVEDRQEELGQIDARITGLKEQRQSLSSQIDNMRSELTASEQLASEVAEKRQTVATLDQQIEERQEELLGTADITVEEMQLIKSDSIARNLVQRTIWATSEFLGAQGMLRDKNWRTAAVTANNPVLAQLSDPMTGFLQKVKEHMRKSINSLAKKKRKGR